MNPKAIRLLAKYYFRSFSRRLFVILPLALFSVSLGLFSLILLPALRLKLRGSALLNNVEPQSFKISGKVYKTVDRLGEKDRRPIEGAQVESGGFRTTTSTSGEFHLTILSPAGAHIPVIFSYSGFERVVRISISGSDKSLEQDFVFPDGAGAP